MGRQPDIRTNTRGKVVYVYTVTFKTVKDGQIIFENNYKR